MELVALRNSLNLTQAAFAEKLGVSPGYIGDLERGHRGLSLKVAARLDALTGKTNFVSQVVDRKTAA
jgi:transcriptional regulator with XRE-family HTH domain